MLERIKKSPLARATGIYGGASLLNALLPFILLPILTKTLSKESVGIELNFRILGGILAQFVGLSTVGSIQRLYYDREARDLPRYIVNCLILGAITAFVLAGLVWALANPIHQVTGISPDWQWALVLFAVFTFLNQVTLGLFQVQVEPKKYGAYQLSLTLINLLLTLWLILGLHWDWQGRVIAQVVATGTLALIGIGILKKNGLLVGKYDAEDFRYAVRQGTGLFFHQLGGVLNGVGDRLFLSGIAGQAAAASYGAAYTVMMPIQLAQDAFNKSYIPWLFERLKKDEPGFKERAVKLTYRVDLALIGSATLLSFIAPPILIALTTEKYRDAIPFLPLIGFSYALYGASKLRACFNLYAEQMGSQSVVTILAGLLNAGLSWWLIYQIGAVGAGVASLIGAAFYFVASWWLSNRIFPMPWFPMRSAE